MSDRIELFSTLTVVEVIDLLIPRRGIEPRFADSKSAVLVRHTRKTSDFRSAGTLGGYSIDRRKGNNVRWLIVVGYLLRRFLGVEDTEDAPWGTVESEFHPIHSAARMRDVATVLKELESGVDVDFVCERAKNGDGGNTALWYAAQGPLPGGIEVAKVLIDAGAEANRQCEHGRTALHMAAAWGHLDLVKFLLENSADPTIRDEENMTPAMVARHGYRSNHVTHDERRDVLLYFDSLGLE